MKRHDACKLHNEDEVTVKETGKHVHVLDAYLHDDGRTVLVECDDGNTYTHREVS